MDNTRSLPINVRNQRMSVTTITNLSYEEINNKGKVKTLIIDIPNHVFNDILERRNWYKTRGTSQNNDRIEAIFKNKYGQINETKKKIIIDDVFYTC